MKSIILFRHGKSSWEEDVTDRYRGLKDRGKRDSMRVSTQFAKVSKIPELIFSSPAKRSLLTCKIFTKTCNLPEKIIKIDENLYDFSGESVIRFVKNLPNDKNEVMIFGHNHALTSISNIFGSQFIDNLPTSGLVKINFDCSEWQYINKGETELIIIPKELR